jgi:tetratricopeptide (TPR) repeat protein
VAELGVQAAEALDHAHQAGIVHRDVKPANLLVDGSGKLWVADFGLARLQSDPGVTLTGDLVGTLRYMSPEQALAQRVVVDHRTDVYSLGVTLYELLTLQPAFPGDDRQELLRRIAFEEPRRPRQVNRAIPPELETVVLKACEKNPAERYATAQELGDDLRRFLDDRPISARRPTLAQRLRKWGRRHRAAVRAGVVLAGMSAALLVTLTWVAADWRGRRTATQQVVAQALAEADDWQALGKYPEALEAARRAHGLAVGGSASRGLRERAGRRQADLELVQRLDQVPLEKAVAVKEGPFDYELADRRYGEEFRAAGIDVDLLTAEEAAARVRVTTVAVALAAALDSWAVDRRAWKKEGAWEHLLQVARRADPDPVRCRLRDALAAGDKQALLDLAKAEDISALARPSLVLLGSSLSEVRERDQAVQLFRRAQRLHPADFWINYNLGGLLGAGWHEGETREVRSQREEEAVRFASVAVALRPQSPGALLLLGDALSRHGRADEADACFREALHLRPGYATVFNSRGMAYFSQGRWDEAIASWREAVRAEPSGVNYNNLAMALEQVGRWDEAIASWREAVRAEPAFPGFCLGLGRALVATGRVDEAIPLLEQMLEERRKAGDVPANYPDTWVYMSCLAGAYLVAGRVQDAIRLDEQALAETMAARGPEDWKTLTRMHDLALSYQAGGKLDQADRLLRDLLERYLKKGDQASYGRAQATSTLGLNLLKQERYVEAEPLLRECLTTDTEKPDLWPRVHVRWTHFHAMSLLGGALAGQKRYPEAEPLLLQGYEGMKQREAMIWAGDKQYLLEAAERLVRLYEATDQPEKARAWREKAKPDQPEAAAGGVKAPGESPAPSPGTQPRR